MGIGILVFGVFYWATWRIILPKLGQYELVPAKQVLQDGTVVTIVRVDWQTRQAPLTVFCPVLSQGIELRFC